MNFISFSFAVFFIIFVCLYHISAKSKKHSLIFQQILILCASFVFYAFADFHFIPFLLYILLQFLISQEFLLRADFPLPFF